MTHRTTPAHSSTKNNHPRNPDDEDTHAAFCLMDHSGRDERRILENAEPGPLLHGDRRKKIHGPQVNRKPSQARLTFAGRVGSRVR